MKNEKLSAAKRHDLVGKKFGRLTVLSLAAHRLSDRVTWACRCECGASKDVVADNLCAGRTTSCGCFRRELAAVLIRSVPRKAPPSLCGKRFGRLIVEHAVRLEATNFTAWSCKCDCGRTSIVQSGSLLRGDSKSCGCFSVDFHRARMYETSGLGRWDRPKMPPEEFSVAMREARKRFLSSEWYLRDLISRQSGCVAKDTISPEMIELERDHLSLRRLALELKQAANQAKESK